MSEQQYDLIIVGAGPGGYIAAERAGSLGRKVLLVEKDKLGGVCLNRGCIPTKTLLHASKLYAHAKEGARFGVSADNVRFDLGAAMEHKRKTVETLRRGIASQMKRFGVTVIEGEARLIGSSEGNRVQVGNQTYAARNLIIATGSSPAMPPIPGLQEGVARGQVLTSTELLEISELPKRLVIVGGGYIGMEFASFFGTLGTEVTVVEMMDEIVPIMDREFAAILRKAVKGVKYELGARVERIDGTVVNFSRGPEQGRAEGDLVLVSVGRRPNVDGIGLAEAGLDIDRSGIRVNEYLQTNLPGVYAIGDVTGKSLLAHSASRMGEVAVRHMFQESYRGEKPPSVGNPRAAGAMRYGAIPWVVFTSPEVAGCGLTEEQAAAEGRRVNVASIPMAVSGRYLAEHPGERGTCKVICAEENGALLGVHMIGSGCSELIFGASLMIESELRVQDVREIVFPHPTVSEVLRDAIWEVE
ncbi:MAG TPA: dihydrolipoyl dehydrogenase [Spirochaetia bacterium]|nr:dihydrolipoyl dehydrogenase [Spirochaetia bacterium]